MTTILSISSKQRQTLFIYDSRREWGKPEQLGGVRGVEGAERRGQEV